MIAIGSITAVASILLFDLSWAHGVWVGHRELVLYRDRLDFRLAAQTPTPIFGLATPRTEAEAQQIAENWRDGITSDSMAHLRWLSLPAFDFSLWWGISAVLLAPCWWLLRRPGPRVGFPIGGTRDTRGGAGYSSARGVGRWPAGSGGCSNSRSGHPVNSGQSLS